MRNWIIAGLAAVLVSILGIQIYLALQLNDRLNHLNQQESRVTNPQTIIPELPKFNLPKPGSDDKFFKNQPWNPYAELQQLQNEMDQIFSDSFSRFQLNTPSDSLRKTPETDLQEKPDRYIVTINAPGADTSSLDVKLEGRQLNISIKTEHAQDKTDDSNGQYSYQERFIGEFYRVLTLPGSANAAKMATDYHNGVLTITIPKA